VTQPGDPGHDAQHVAFAEADESDWAAAAQLMEDAVVHEPGDPDAPPIRTPEEWDEDEWDSERQPPKSAREATGALAQRVATPEAPDATTVDYEFVELTPGQRGDA
jgi:hypothetical protein